MDTLTIALILMAVCIFLTLCGESTYPTTSPCQPDLSYQKVIRFLVVRVVLILLGLLLLLRVNL
jgi:hypothetical protein